ncbi:MULTISPECIES: tyrosine-type recombinase/integrase [Bacillus cereus group]|uniref:tyrosine-type recombinase/integrase n=1 Tax=Bacillus cereus group TaxID=86661 RepID=UPI0012397B01|nr:MULTISPECIES: site-specific integrase [Bacillus cereus group]KAA6466185.1 transposase [Bacillus cereus]KAB2415179.1 tyrosine-type recombinase/integrase [Bacillus cereus]KAB2436465.1 tyrosine-type recombinase/integrase [Bacillus cereus]KAB2463204.1 tyrosine-type recombinase/integrase [Bacillus cereus]MCU5596807.1 tyrosine-type recombinase/integrase [Bacillus wiedmannii]
MKLPSVATNRKLVTSTEISKRISEMNSALQGFWSADKWDIRSCPQSSAIELSENSQLRNRWINFDKVKNVWLRTELKYFYYIHLNNGTWNAQAVWIRKGTVLNKMLIFLELEYPNIKSITEVPIEKALMKYRAYLTEQGVKTTVTNYKLDGKQNKIPISGNSYYVTNLKQLMEFYEDFYFDGEEWDKDVWNRRKLSLPQDKVNPTSREYTINFKCFNNNYFKELVKRYCRLMLNTCGFSHVRDIASKLKEFFNCIDKNIRRVNQLTRKEVEKYLNEINSKGLKPSTISGRISILEVFFNTIKNFDWKDVPSKVLIFKEDYPRVPKAQPRYIDEYVLEQLNAKLDRLEPYIATMVMILQECGMRISELCTLKHGSVITDKEGDCFLKYYQWKMKKEHIIPISKEIAKLIFIQEEKISVEFKGQCEYLFPRKDGTPLKQDTFRGKLNELSYKEKIMDKKGEIVRFHAHAFRHTVGTRMINNGVPQHMVQKFLGHESPEMTARYAHIFDETLKKEFEKFKEKLVTNNGSVLDFSEEETLVDNTDLQWFKKNINAQALPNGYCRLPVIAGPCPHANACLDCTNFCTSKQFLGEHEAQLEHTKQLLDRAKQNQWKRQIETNERVKKKLEQIISTLKEEK